MKWELNRCDVTFPEKSDSPKFNRPSGNIIYIHRISKKKKKSSEDFILVGREALSILQDRTRSLCVSRAIQFPRTGDNEDKQINLC